MPQIAIQSMESFREALDATPTLMLFKHSPICPVSHAAHEQWERFRAEHPGATTLFVDVIAARPVARGLATEVGVPHASPQAILFVQGQPVWDASHGDLIAPTLAAAWAEHGDRP